MQCCKSHSEIPFPQENNIQPFSISFSRLLPTFIPTKCFGFLPPCWTSDAVASWYSPLVATTTPLLHPDYVSRKSTWCHVSWLCVGAVVWVVKLLNQGKRYIYLVSIYYSSIHQYVYLHIYPAVHTSSYVYISLHWSNIRPSEIVI